MRELLLQIICFVITELGENFILKINKIVSIDKWYVAKRTQGNKLYIAKGIKIFKTVLI